MRRSVLLTALTVVMVGTFPAGCHAQPQQTTDSAQTAVATATAGVWSPQALGSLRQWIDSAPSYGLPRPDAAVLDTAVKAGDAGAVDAAADAMALKLARMHALGCTPAAQRAAWHVNDSDARIDLPAALHAAVATGSLDEFYNRLQPRHPDFQALRTALQAEADPGRKATLLRNLDRWRWLPHDLGGDYLLVNAAAFTVQGWRGGRKVDEWRVVVGKTESPTLAFAATVTGVTVNPWWEIPANIVRESVGAMVRRNPRLAAQRGYVWGGGRYRQRPGPGNSLGVMKLAMANPFNVYLHDTPSKALFDKEVRAFSHGCVRVDRPLDLAAVLLAPARSRAELDAIVATGKTVTLALPAPMPVYVAYFTAIAGPDGAVRFLPDIYGRDSAMGDGIDRQHPCAA